MSDSDISTTVDFFTKAFPNPISKNFHTQLGVHYEEITEFTRSMVGKDQKTQFLLDMVAQANSALAK